MATATNDERKLLVKELRYMAHVIEGAEYLSIDTFKVRMLRDFSEIGTESESDTKAYEPDKHWSFEISVDGEIGFQEVRR